MAAHRLVRRKPKTRKFIDRTGKRYGKLTVESLVGFKGVNAVWRVRCDCGAVETCFGTRLAVSAQSRWACRKCNGKDGRTEHPLYVAWHSLKRSGRLCVEWCDFHKFAASVGARPRGQRLVRLDRSKTLGPGNWKWGTVAESVWGDDARRIKSSSGEVKSVAEWCRKLGISKQRLYQRLAAMPEHVAVSFRKDGSSPEYRGWKGEVTAKRKHQRWREKHLQKLARSFERLANGELNGHAQPERLSHDARRERRRKIAEAVRAGKKPSEVCREFGVGMATVAAAMEEFA